MATHARGLAERLAGLDDEALAELFRRRSVNPDARWRDFFDAAEALLDEAAISRVLPGLTRAEAGLLADTEVPTDAAEASRAHAHLHALALLDETGAPYPSAVGAVAGRAVPAASDSPAPPASADDQAAHAAERAFRHVAAVADVLLAARDAPVTMLSDGRAGAGERRRFADARTLPEGTELDDLIALATGSRLAVIDERLLHVSTRGEEWLRMPAGRRWAALAESLRDRMPRGIRTSTGGWTPIGDWLTAHPWDPEWPGSRAAIDRRARMLGLIADDDSEPAWAVPLRRGDLADPELLERMLPAEVDKIFLQNDLSAISPGPLATARDVRLRTIAVRESASQASSYRFTAESVAHAFALGETEESLLTFLDDLSLTGIPQPLRYLIGQTAARHGLVRVSSDAGRTRIRSADAHLLDTIAVDQTLRPLGLVRDGDALATRVAAGTAYWALCDARYPATLIGLDGAPVVTGRHPAVPVPDAVADFGHAALITRLRAAQGTDADAAWLERALESAVHGRAVLVVEVAMPDGSTRELTLEATGLGGGRLRGKDRAADVERTLPVSSIRSVRPA